MGAKIVGSMISFCMMCFLTIAVLAFSVFQTENGRINDICYEYAETVSTKGVLSEEVYSHFLEDISRYGDFEVTLMLRTVTEEGYEDTFYSEEDILGKSLQTGDMLTFAVYGLDSSLAEKLTGQILRPSAVKTAYII